MRFVQTIFECSGPFSVLRTYGTIPFQASASHGSTSAGWLSKPSPSAEEPFLDLHFTRSPEIRPKSAQHLRFCQMGISGVQAAVCDVGRATKAKSISSVEASLHQALRMFDGRSFKSRVARCKHVKCPCRLHAESVCPLF